MEIAAGKVRNWAFVRAPTLFLLYGGGEGGNTLKQRTHERNRVLSQTK